MDEFITGLRIPNSQASTGTAEDVEALGPLGPFDFPWPAQYGTEHFDSATAYRLASLDESSVIVGWTRRLAWGRDRRRAVVFHRKNISDEPRQWYPLTEFVETDTGVFAAQVPDPEQPRAILRDGQSLPRRFSGKVIARADEVFDSVRKGPSLRLLVNEAEEPEMVRHGFWVGQLRGRVGEM
jgi:hypothetical protein